MVAREIISDTLISMWADQLMASKEPPFNIGNDSLFVAFFASAEISCFHKLGWPSPENVLDLYAESRRLWNPPPDDTGGRSLIDVARRLSLDPPPDAFKEEMRALAIRGGLYNDTEKETLLSYCRETSILRLKFWLG